MHAGSERASPAYLNVSTAEYCRTQPTVMSEELEPLPEHINKHELTIFKLSESISNYSTGADSTRRSDSSDGFGQAHPKALQADLTYYKDLFSKLRFNYLEQVTKEKFLRAIIEDPPLIVEREENARLEEELSSAKKELQERKAIVEGILVQLDDLSRRLSTDYEQLTAEIEEARKLPGQIADTEAQITKLKEEGLGSDFNLPLCDTLAQAELREAELADLELQLEEINRVLPDRQQRLHCLNDEISPMESNKEGLERFAHEAVKMRDSARAAGKADRENAGQWYQSSYETLSALLQE